MSAINIEELAGAIVNALRGELTSGFNSVSAFARTQAKRLATQAALIAEGRLSGQIDDDMLEFFDGQLQVMARNFARAMAERTIITLQRAWNAIVDTVWNSLNRTLNVAGFGTLPVPAAPNV